MLFDVNSAFAVGFPPVYIFDILGYSIDSYPSSLARHTGTLPSISDSKLLLKKYHGGECLYTYNTRTVVAEPTAEVCMPLLRYHPRVSSSLNITEEISQVTIVTVSPNV